MHKNQSVVVVEKRAKILLIKFNNPKRKNCIDRAGYEEIGRALRAVAQDDAITVVVLTGVGDFFTAGNDLAVAANALADIDAYIKESSSIFREMISAVIDCPKLLIALVNGPAIGIGATIAGLCDLVWCAEEAYFLTPFVKLGIVPEACSSYLFPIILGRSKATEMLLLGEAMTAKEAYHFGFASKIFKTSEMRRVIWPKLVGFSELPVGALTVSKKILRMQERDSLYRALAIESEVLNKRFHTEEFVNSIIEFSQRKGKSHL